MRRSSTRTASTSARRRAVRRTAARPPSTRSPTAPSPRREGEIATWQGRPIDALYTATCGGHTEDAKEIFPEQAAPYLVGVPCRAEAEAPRRARAGVLTGASPIAVVTENGEDVTRDVVAAFGLSNT